MYEDLLYKRIAQLRYAKGVSARDMSLSIGQSENYINMIENRKSLPSMTAFFYICDYLGVHPKEFFDDSMDNPVQQKALSAKLQALTKEQVDHIMTLIDDILA